MSGFGSVVGFLFVFFILAFTFSAVFISYNNQITSNSKLINQFAQNPVNSLDSDFTLENPFYMSGRLSFQVFNGNKYDLTFSKNGASCFSFFENSQYVKTSDLFTNILKNIPSDYTIISKNGEGIFSSKINFNSSKDNSYELVSCNGIKKYITIKAGDDDWWNSSWDQRKRITVTNNANTNLAQYQVEVNLNSSNFDFSLGKENEIRFLYPLKNSLVLDTPFDSYSQKIKDYSSFSDNVTLGQTSAVESSDPTSTSGVILNGLNFNGIDQEITIQSTPALQLNNSLTYAAWVKWSGAGNKTQVIFSNGNLNNSLSVINDGSSNSKKIRFSLNIGGVVDSIYSNSTLDSNWHFVTGVYDGSQMKLYVDGVLNSNFSVMGNVNTFKSNNYIGSSGNGNYFNGSIDEMKVFNIDLKPSEVQDLYYNNLRFRKLDYYISNFDFVNQKAKIFVKVPAIQANSKVSLDLYYDNRNGVTSNSSMVKTFNYTTPRIFGYVVSNQISGSTGLSILSLYNSNVIQVGTANILSLNQQQGTTLPKNSVSQNDYVKAKSLAQVEGNGNGADIIVPASWASTHFTYRGFRNSGTKDDFCMLSPWGTSNVTIIDAGSAVWNGNVNSAGTCQLLNIGTADDVVINASIPILVSYYGTSNQDSFVFYPSTNEDLYGIPSANGYLATDSQGALVSIYRSDGSTASYNLGAYGTASFSSGGTQGATFAHKLVSTNGGLMGAIQQADGDGTESSVFAPLKEMGTRFGSDLAAQYITLASKYSDANCSVYDSTGTLLGNIVNGTGNSNYGIYNYSFGAGGSATYANAGWRVDCSKPVWGYYEKASLNAETNFITSPMMRQYIYPSPTIVVN